MIESTTVSFVNNAVYANTAGVSGGGLEVYDSTVAIAGNSIYSNTAASGSGGGLFVNDSAVVLSNTTVSGNTANSDGGGVYNDNSGTTTLRTSTVTGNTAGANDNGIGDGGGVSVVSGTLTYTNTVVAANDDRSTPEHDDCGGTPASGGYNLVGDGTGCPTGGSGDQATTDPRLGLLSDNAGPTWTHAVLPDSPAIDKGACSGTSVDQRGYARPVDIPDIVNAYDGCDVGAYELQQWPRLFLMKSVDDESPEPGQRITFTIMVINNGTAPATGAVISDTIPVSLTFATPVTLQGRGGALAEDSGQLPIIASGLLITAGERITASFPVTVHIGLAEGTALTNTAAVTSVEVSSSVVGASGITVTADGQKNDIHLPIIYKDL